MTKPSDLHLIEILAVAIHSRNDPTGLPLEVWRNDSVKRDGYRQDARALILDLESQGIQVKITNPTKVLKAIADIITIPARPAYPLEPEEVASEIKG